MKSVVSLLDFQALFLYHPHLTYRIVRLTTVMEGPRAMASGPRTPVLNICPFGNSYLSRISIFFFRALSHNTAIGRYNRAKSPTHRVKTFKTHLPIYTSAHSRVRPFTRVPTRRKDTVMTTESQITAKRKNAKKSTGPKTAESKAKSAQNATKLGAMPTPSFAQACQRPRTPKPPPNRPRPFLHLALSSCFFHLDLCFSTNPVNPPSLPKPVMCSDAAQGRPTNVVSNTTVAARQTLADARIEKSQTHHHAIFYASIILSIASKPHTVRAKTAKVGPSSWYVNTTADARRVCADACIESKPSAANARPTVPSNKPYPSATLLNNLVNLVNHV